jgi:transposase InsO family protein
MSLISGSYSRACGGGGAPDCRGDIVENCLKEGVRCEAAKVALQLRARGARRARAGSRRFLEAVRTPRLIADMIVNWIERGEFQLQRRVQASPKENLRLATLLFGLDFMAGPFVPRNLWCTPRQ